MKINNPVTTQPNFTAKVKNNDFMQGYVKNAGFFEKKSLKNSLEKLNKVYPNDTLEITKDNKTAEYVVKNKNKKTESRFESFVNTTIPMMDVDQEISYTVKLSSILKSIAKPGTDEHNKVFGTKQPESSNEEKEIFDMLA